MFGRPTSHTFAKNCYVLVCVAAPHQELWLLWFLLSLSTKFKIEETTGRNLEMLQFG